MQYFSSEEFACKREGCSKGVESMSTELLEKLDAAREQAQTPFTITSSIRCETCNEAVGGSPTSSHVDGLAVDIAATDSVKRYRVVSACLNAGFDRGGISKAWFVHVDVDGTKPSGVMWTY